MAIQDLLALLGPQFMGQPPARQQPFRGIPDRIDQMNADEAKAGIPELERLGVMPRDAGGSMIPSLSQLTDGLPTSRSFSGRPNIPAALDVMGPPAPKEDPTITSGPRVPIPNWNPVSFNDNPGVRVEAPWRHMGETEQGANQLYLANLHAATTGQSDQAQLAHLANQSQYQNANLMQHLMAMQQENALRNKEFGLQQEKFAHQKSVDEFLRSPTGQAQRDVEALIKGNTAQNLAKGTPSVLTDIQNARLRAGMGQPPGTDLASKLGPLADLLGKETTPGVLQPLDQAMTEIYQRTQADPALLTMERLSAMSKLLPQLYGQEAINKYRGPFSYGEKLMAVPRALNPFTSRDDWGLPYKSRLFWQKAFENVGQ